MFACHNPIMGEKCCTVYTNVLHIGFFLVLKKGQDASQKGVCLTNVTVHAKSSFKVFENGSPKKWIQL